MLDSSPRALLILRGRMGFLCHLQVEMLDGVGGNLQRPASLEENQRTIVQLQIRVNFSSIWPLQG